MSEYAIIRDGDRREFDEKEEFEYIKGLLEEGDEDFETETPDEPPTMSEDGKPQKTRATHPEAFDGGTPNAEPEPQGNADEPTLREDPIGYLRDVNTEYVNTVKGTPAISKRGFRYIQAELDITTESEVVGWVDDPYGVVVWARAELPDGRAAEAHGEGYPSESGFDESEFVRYADTRAKNRALSDLTSAGALAVDELRGGIDDE